MRPPTRLDLSADTVRSIFTYNPETGGFTRIHGTAKVVAGGIAGTTNGSGYRLLSIDGRKYRAHRIAWLWMTGAWPAGEIDHRNGVRDDNRWENLRDVPMVVNQQNRRKPLKTSIVGLLGVSPTKRGFKSQIHAAGLGIYLGSFDSPQEAQEAYLKAKRVLHPGCTL